MLQNPFAVRPSYTTLNALRHVHNPLCNALQPSYDGLQHVHDPVTTLYNAFAIPSQRSTTRSQSHYDALQPYYSFVTTSYNPSTTLYDTFTIPSQRSTTLLQFRYKR